MKIVFIFILIGASLLVSAPARAEGTDAAAPQTAQRLSAIVSYVVADYPGAVRGGQILAAAEYAEQGGLLAEGAKIAASLAGPPEPKMRLKEAYAAVERAFADKVAEPELARVGRRVQQLLREELGLVLSPTGAPNRSRALQLYTEACARCHGADGRAQTEEAKKLEPRPVSFFDEARMQRISPELAFQALSFGVTGTGMASFDSLSSADRWSLAFFVSGMRHRREDVSAGLAVLAHKAPQLAMSPSHLAPLTDEDLRAALSTLTATEQGQALAALHLEAPWRSEPGGRFAVARARLEALDKAALDPVRARELAVAAYLEGIEPQEAPLRARDAALCERLEKTFLGLRQSIEAGVLGAPLREEIARAQLVLDSVEERAAGGASVPFLAAFAIALREGFELSLLLAALLAFLRKAGREGDARYVHLGWVVAIPAGALTWFAVGAALSGARREVTEGTLTLLAAAMLLFVSHFVLGRLESRRWLKFLERSTIDAGGQAESRVGLALFSVAFVAAFREAIEIVLFFKALLLDSPTGPWPVVGGAAAGLAVLVVIVQVLSRIGRRMNPRPLMLVSSLVLTVLAISLVGQGVRALQEGGILGLHPIAFPRLPVLGLYPTAQGLGAQLVVVLLVVVPTLLERRRACRAPLARPA